MYKISVLDCLEWNKNANAVNGSDVKLLQVPADASSPASSSGRHRDVRQVAQQPTQKKDKHTGGVKAGVSIMFQHGLCTPVFWRVLLSQGVNSVAVATAITSPSIDCLHCTLASANCGSISPNCMETGVVSAAQQEKYE